MTATPDRPDVNESRGSHPLTLNDLMENFEEGAVLDQINADITSVARAVQRTGNDGQITLTMKFKASGGQGVSVGVACNAKAPRPTFTPRGYFLHPDGLHGHHPEQRQIGWDEERSGEKEKRADIDL